MRLCVYVYIICIYVPKGVVIIKIYPLHRIYCNRPTSIVIADPLRAERSLIQILIQICRHRPKDVVIIKIYPLHRIYCNRPTSIVIADPLRAERSLIQILIQISRHRPKGVVIIKVYPPHRIYCNRPTSIVIADPLRVSDSDSDPNQKSAGITLDIFLCFIHLMTSRLVSYAALAQASVATLSMAGMLACVGRDRYA